MDEASIKNYILDTFSGVEIITVDGNNFYFLRPRSRRAGTARSYVPLRHAHDQRREDDAVSNLSRPGINRLNIGVSKATYQSLFGADAQQFGRSRLQRPRPDHAAPGLRLNVLGLCAQSRRPVDAEGRGLARRGLLHGSREV